MPAPDARTNRPAIISTPAFPAGPRSKHYPRNRTARRDQHDHANVRVAYLVRHVTCEALERVSRRCCGVTVRRVAGHGSVDVDDVAGVLLLHDRQHMFGADVGPRRDGFSRAGRESPRSERAAPRPFRSRQNKARCRRCSSIRRSDRIESRLARPSPTLRFPGSRLL